MGMDVYGKSGNYFRRNIWGWHSLGEYITETFPEIAGACTYWHTNDGDGLDAAGAAALADAIDAAVAGGSAARYVAERDARIAAMPDEICRWCSGTGIRTDEVGLSMKQPERPITEEGHPRQGQVGWCNGCDGRGTHRPSDASYHLEVDDLREFAAFMRESGGFEIW